MTLDSSGAEAPIDEEVSINMSGKHATNRASGVFPGQSDSNSRSPLSIESDKIKYRVYTMYEYSLVL